MSVTPSTAERDDPRPKIVNLCRGCGKDFAFLSGFDHHRVGTHDYTFLEGIRRDPPAIDGRRCLDTDEMLKAGWRLDKHGRWLSPDGNTDLSRVEL